MVSPCSWPERELAQREAPLCPLATANVTRQQARQQAGDSLDGQFSQCLPIHFLFFWVWRGWEGLWLPR